MVLFALDDPPTPALDLAVAAAANVTRRSYGDALRVVAAYEAGERPLPGTPTDRIVTAWLGAREVMRMGEGRENA